MTRAPCCEKDEVRKGPWTPEEDALLVKYVSENGEGNWSTVPKKAGLNRCGKSCRLRWANYLRPDLKRGTFSEEEENLIVNLHKTIGNRWAKIATELPGRTDNDIKNHWNTRLKKRLREQGVDPDTHLPLEETAKNKAISSGEDQPNQPACAPSREENGSPAKKLKVSRDNQEASTSLRADPAAAAPKKSSLFALRPYSEGENIPMPLEVDLSDSESAMKNAFLVPPELRTMSSGTFRVEESGDFSQESESTDQLDSPTSVIREAVALLQSGNLGAVQEKLLAAAAAAAAATATAVSVTAASAHCQAPAPQTILPKLAFKPPSLEIPPVLAPEMPISQSPLVKGSTLMSPFMLKSLWNEDEGPFWSEADMDMTLLQLPSPTIIPLNTADSVAKTVGAKTLLGELTAFDALPAAASQVPKEKPLNLSKAVPETFKAIQLDTTVDAETVELFQAQSELSPLCKISLPMSPWMESFSSPQWPSPFAASTPNFKTQESL